MQPDRHPTIDEMDMLLREAHLARSAVLFTLCSRLRDLITGHTAATASAKPA